MGGPDPDEARESGSLGDRATAMPLTDFQRRLLGVLGPARMPDSYLAGGAAALHFAPNSLRYSHDLHFFHDSTERVAVAFAEDSGLLQAADYTLEIMLSQPGFIRAIVGRDGLTTRIDWAHDSAWRFMPPVQDELGGFLTPRSRSCHQQDAGAGRA